LNPQSVAAAHKLAQSYVIQQDFGRAAPILNKLASIYPNHLKILENAGLSSLEVERYDDAKRHAAQLAKIDESNKKGSIISARVKIHEGDYENIVATLRNSHSEEEIVRFLNNAGVKMSKGQNFAEALKMYKSAITALGDGSKFAYAIYYNIGLAHKNLGAIQDARKAFERTLRLKPDFEKARTALNDLDKG